MNVKNMEDVRIEIDNIDLQIVKLISRRGEYDHIASKLKKNEIDVFDEDRVNSMLKNRRDWAENKDIEPDVIEKLFSFIQNIKGKLQFFLFLTANCSQERSLRKKRN